MILKWQGALLWYWKETLHCVCSGLLKCKALWINRLLCRRWFKWPWSGDTWEETALSLFRFLRHRALWVGKVVLVRHLEMAATSWWHRAKTFCNIPVKFCWERAFYVSRVLLRRWSWNCHSSVMLGKKRLHSHCLHFQGYRALWNQ